METEIKTEGEAIDTTNDAGEGQSTEAETISVPKGDYDKLNQTLGSLKRELKDLKKSKEDSVKETSTKNPTDENRLMEKIERMSLRNAGVTHQDDIDLAKSTAKKWGVDIDEVLGDEDFKVKLERQQSNRSNIEATSNVRGSTGKSQAKDTPEYWIAKGTPPSSTDVPNRKTRAKIARAMISSAKTSKTFYNE